MNIQLANTEEFINGKSSGTLGQVLIRSVLQCPIHIRAHGRDMEVNEKTGVTMFFGLARPTR